MEPIADTSSQTDEPKSPIGPIFRILEADHLNFRSEEDVFKFQNEPGPARPLSIRMAVSERLSQATVLHFLANTANWIETLVISGIIQNQMPLPPMPSLKKLDISYYCGRNCTEENVYTFDALTTLIIRGGDAFPFNVPLLTKLQVNCGVPLARDRLLRFLTQCPLLEILGVGYNEGVGEEYYNCNQDIEMMDYDQEIYPAVDLPHLRLFYSHSAKKNEHILLFNNLTLPPSCAVVFNYCRRLNTLSSHYPLPLAGIKRVRLKTRNGNGAVELIDDENNHRVYVVTNMNPCGQDPDQAVSNQITIASYASFLRGLGANTVDVLFVEGSFPWSPSRADDVLSFLGETCKKLVLSGSVAAHYLRALAPEPIGNIDESEVDWRCPTLTELVVYAHNRIDPDDTDISSLLPQITKRRKVADMPIRTISLFVHDPQGESLENLPEQLCKSGVEHVKVVKGVDALSWDIDSDFFDGLDIQTYRESHGDV